MVGRSKEIPKLCSFCGKEFLAYRNSSKYCSNTCRYAWQSRNLSEKSLERRQRYQKKWGLENWQRKRDYNILRTFGLNREQYEKLLVEQHHCCGVCGRHETEFGTKLAIDHDHDTGEIYGLLCHKCNHRLIGKERRPEIFIRAAEYLKKGTGWFVPIIDKTKKKRRKKRR